MPKPTVATKEKILNVAIEMVKELGLSSLSARSLADKLNCSTQPIYNIFQNMDELKVTVLDQLAVFMMNQITEYQKTKCTFLDSGLGYIHFAKTENKLFHLFCLDKEVFDLICANEMPHPDIGDEIIRSLMEEELKDVPISPLSKDRIFQQIMIFTYGLAVLAYLDRNEMNDEKTAELLQKTFEDHVNRELEGVDYEYSCNWR